MKESYPKPKTDAHVIELLETTEALKGVLRLNRVLNGERPENTAEHSWQAALMAYCLRSWSNEDIDTGRVMLLLLVHDLVEVEAGDTDPFDEKSSLGKQEKEINAALKLFGNERHLVLDEIHEAWKEFEFSDTAEAKFARSVDMFMPLFLNAIYDGTVWVHSDLTRSGYIEKKKSIADGSAKLWEYCLELIDYSAKRGWILEG